MAYSDLPQEIMREIFLCLPVKSIGKSRCLSKTWNTQLSTTEFVNSHLIRHQGEENQLIVVRSGSLYIVNIPLGNEEEVLSREIRMRNELFVVLGSCNGLVLLMKDIIDRGMFVVNPVTRQQVKIPRLGSGRHQIFGFGYDPSCDDYKVVVISNYYEPKNEDEQGNFVDVYSLRKRVWKSVCRFGFGIPYVWTMPFLDGAVHWLTPASNYRINAFHLANETFHQFPFPEGFGPRYIYSALVVLKGCLGIIETSTTNGSTDVWVMKEYGAVDSWVKFRVDVSMLEKAAMRPVCYNPDYDTCLYVTTDDTDCFVACNLTRENIIGFCDLQWSIFAESLVSPEQANVVSRQELF